MNHRLRFEDKQSFTPIFIPGTELISEIISNVYYKTKKKYNKHLPTHRSNQLSSHHHNPYVQEKE